MKSLRCVKSCVGLPVVPTTSVCGADGHAARRGAGGCGWQGSTAARSTGRLRGPAARITTISWLRARARASVSDSVGCDYGLIVVTFVDLYRSFLISRFDRTNHRVFGKRSIERWASALRDDDSTFEPRNASAACAAAPRSHTWSASASEPCPSHGSTCKSHAVARRPCGMQIRRSGRASEPLEWPRSNSKVSATPTCAAM